MPGERRGVSATPDRRSLQPAAGEESMWASGGAYEGFMGRWSRRVARDFLKELAVQPAANWLDVGCGAGSLTDTIVERADPRSVVAVDPSAELLKQAAQQVSSPRVTFQQAAAERLPFPARTFDAAVSGLVLNFLENAEAGMREMAKVTRPGGVVGAYVWDYAYPDFFLARLWEAVLAADGRPAPTDERGRWPVCSPDGLAALAARSGLSQPRVWTIDIETTFASSDELWRGFLLGIGPSGAWVVGLPPTQRHRLRRHLLERLPAERDGSVRLRARAIAVAASVSDR